MKRIFLFAALAFFATSALAQVKISELPPATTPLNGNEQVPMNQGGTTVRGTTALQTSFTLTALQELTTFTPAGAWRYTFPGTATNPTIYLDSALPRLDYAATGGLRYSEFVNPTEYSLNSCNAAGSTCSPAIRVLGSTGGSVIAVTFGDDAGQVFTWDGSLSPWVVNGDSGLSGQVLTSNGNANSPSWQDAGAAIVSSGTFTATWETACTTNPTQNWKWIKVGSLVTLTALQNVNCTSDSATFTASGALPVAIRPDASQRIIGLASTNNGTPDLQLGCLHVETDGSMSVRRSSAAPCDGTQFTNTGLKGFNIQSAGGTPQGPQAFTYDMDVVP